MKLIHCHIDNFGGLHNYDMDFDESLNIILQDNGWGKTTFAAYLKAMLYGFDTRRSKDITENERRRYFPWQGGQYGGFLDIEFDGKRYRVYRSFGETPRFDKTRVIDLTTNTTAKINADNLGETLFHLDASAFQRSIFINQNGLSMDGAASSIHTRLNMLVSQANDLAVYDEAINKITSQMRVYEKRGQQGLIDDITRQIADKESERGRLEAAISGQDAARARITEIDALLTAIRSDIDKKKSHLEEISGEIKKHEATQNILDDLNRKIAEIQNIIDRLEADLGGTVPVDSQIEHIRGLQKDSEAFAVQLKELGDQYRKLAQEYEALLISYGRELPTAEQLDEIQRIYGELQGFLASEKGQEFVEGVPEECEAFVPALAMYPNYLDRLSEVAATESRLQALILKSSEQNRKIRYETENWKEKKRQYDILTAETEKLYLEIEKQKVYAPSALKPALTKLENLQEKQQALSQKANALDNSARYEMEAWADRKHKYQALTEEIARLEAEIKAKEQYQEAVVQPVIRRLEEIQKKQQLVNLRQSELSGSYISSEEEALVKRFRSSFPDFAEGREVLESIREVNRLKNDVQGLNSRLDGENNKADSLKSSIVQLGTFSEEMRRIEEPQKNVGGVMIGVGVCLMVIGILLAVLVAPPAALLAVLGIALSTVGIVGSNRYKKDLKAYEEYLISVKQYEEIFKQKEELQAQLDVVAVQIALLQEQIKETNSKIFALKERIEKWASVWLPAGAEVNEHSVSEVMDCAAKAMQVRSKKEEIEKKKSFIAATLTEIRIEREHVDLAYPELGAKPIAEALNLLRAAQTEYKIAERQLNTAIQNRSSFVKAAGLSEDDYKADESPEMQKIEDQRKQIGFALSQISAERAKIDIQYPEVTGISFAQALIVLRTEESNYKVIDARYQTAVRNRDGFLSESGLTKEALQRQEPAGLSALKEENKETEKDIELLISADNEILAAVGLHISREKFNDVFSRTRQQLTAFRIYWDKKKEWESRRENRATQMETLKKKLADSSAVLKEQYKEFPMPERLAKIRDDINHAQSLKRKLEENMTEQQKVREQRGVAISEVEAFVGTYMKFSVKTENPIAEIIEKISAYRDQTNAKRELEKQRDGIIAQNMKENASSNALLEKAELQTEIAHLEARREELLMEYQEKGDAIRQADQSLEKYPDVLREIRQLYDQKQKGQATLATLRRTVRIIQTAKENLADRYLSKVEQLFNNYMHIWIDNEQIRGILDIDFNLQIEENGKVHIAQGYSTGYYDMLDFCMRLALVDTLFENEQPFLILDDPFVNLDEKRLEKALEFLNVMAADKQVIYFVCHPIRALEKDVSSHSKEEFAKIAEETRKALAERNAASNLKKKLVRKLPREMYRMVNSDGVLAIQPAKLDYIITNNIFSMNFVLAENISVKEAVYELFFIDAIGHILNERQSIEVKNGKLSNDRILFSLNTREDSGEQFELMIHENGQDDYDVVGRFPFAVKLAFAGTSDFDF